MRNLNWTSSHAVFVTDIDDEHKEIFAAVAELQAGVDAADADLPKMTEHLVGCITGHFAHEERLMRAARYSSLKWHKQLHNAVRRRVGQLLTRIEQGDAASVSTLVGYLTGWLRDHTRIADRMMAAAPQPRAWDLPGFHAGQHAHSGLLRMGGRHRKAVSSRSI